MTLSFFLLKIYKKKKENSREIATPEHTIILNSEERNENISSPENNELLTFSYLNKLLLVLKGMVNSNQRQEFISDYKNKLANSEVIQSLRQGLIKDMRQEIGHNLSNDGQSNSFGINKEIVDHIRQKVIQDMIQDIK